MQTRELQEYAERRGWTVSDEYVDIGISGTKEKRPELDRLMADAHRRRQTHPNSKWGRFTRWDNERDCRINLVCWIQATRGPATPQPTSPKLADRSAQSA